MHLVTAATHPCQSEGLQVESQLELDGVLEASLGTSVNPCVKTQSKNLDCSVAQWYSV